MNKIIITTIVLLLSFIGIRAQDFQGVATYESKTSTADFKNRFKGNKDITPEMQKTMEERMKKMFEKTFILTFDKTASIYKEEEKLEAPGQSQGGGMRIMSNMMGGGGTYYKNTKTKTFAVDKEFMGKEFLVKDSLPKLEWKMESETKQIGGYNCFKATATMAVSKSDFKNFRPKKEQSEETKKEETKKEETKTDDGNKKTSFLDVIEVPKEVTVTAWYTPEIPVNQGPDSYYGLPGLILEVNDGKTVILCSKIVLNPKEKTEIKAPTKGKVVPQNEYDKIVIDKMEEFRQMNQGRGGNGGMRFGGH